MINTNNNYNIRYNYSNYLIKKLINKSNFDLNEWRKYSQKLISDKAKYKN